MRALLVTVACAALLTAGPTAQTADRLFRQFSDAVLAYQRGDVETAASRLSGWSRRDMEHVIPILIKTRERPLLEAAAMLHTELAIRGTAGDAPTVTLHLRLAEALAQAIPAEQASSDFRRHWYAVAASTLLARVGPAPARRFVDEGLGQFAKDAPLHLLSGIIHETLAHLEDPECSGPGCESRGPSSGVPLRLARAEAEYRRALELDARLADARVRLGRVLFLQNRGDRGRDELSAVVRQSADDRTTYLAHLFLGALAVFERDQAAARSEYEAARSLGRAHQTPYVALGFAEQMTGAVARARQTIADMAARPATSITDPWLDYLNGSGSSAGEASLRWLRQRVQQ